MGSCFARNIEEHLARHDLRVPTLDFGVPEDEWSGARRNGILNKYTPAALLSELLLALDGDAGQLDGCLLPMGDGRVVDLQLPTMLTVTEERGAERRQEISALFGAGMRSPVAVVTLGQIETWWDSATGMALNHMPPPLALKHHDGRFWFHRCDYDEVLAQVDRIVELLVDCGTEHVLLTVSPVPMHRTFSGDDPLRAYVHAKSLLRVVAEAVAQRHRVVDYFPAFESIWLGDPAQTWGPDHSHVLDAAVGSVVEALTRAYLAPCN